MHVIYYITSHGYGHGVRTAAICNAFAPDVRITFRTTLPKQFLKEEVRREFGYEPAEFDCGCIQKDSLTTDVDKTFSRYRELALENGRRLPDEAAWCRDRGADLIASDITPFAFDVAQAANIPSVAVTNFTWYDAYHKYAHAVPAAQALLETMQSQYAKASLLLALEPSLPMAYFTKRIETPPVGRAGKDRREAIAQKYGFDPSKKYALIYFGHFGINEIDWQRLEQFRNWEFLSVFPLHNPPDNYRLVPKSDFSYQDLIASADLMIAKIGYCVTSECMLHGTPLLYLPRDDFAESGRLETGIATWGGGHRITLDEFRKMGWGPVLDQVERGKRADVVAPNGALICAREIERLGRRKSTQEKN
jgi:hypothetical protein